MTDWIVGYVGADAAPMVRYGLIGLALLVGLLFLIWLFNRLRHGTFVSGGRSAQPRISVQDAAPVDSHRRLILVRRDEVEHLLLIGGANDLVVESNIRQDSGLGRQASPPPGPPPVLRERPMPPAEPAAYPAPPPRPPQPVAQPPRTLATPTLPRVVDAPPASMRQEPRIEAPAPQAPPVRHDPQSFQSSGRDGPPVLRQPAPSINAAPALDTAPRRQAANLDEELEKMLGEFQVFAPEKP